MDTYEEQVLSNLLNEGERPLRLLSAAIRRGDTAEAELQLDRIAAELGDEAEEQVQQGRYSVRASVTDEIGAGQAAAA